VSSDQYPPVRKSSKSVYERGLIKLYSPEQVGEVKVKAAEQLQEPSSGANGKEKIKTVGGCVRRRRCELGDLLQPIKFEQNPNRNSRLI